MEDAEHMVARAPTEKWNTGGRERQGGKRACVRAGALAGGSPAPHAPLVCRAAARQRPARVDAPLAGDARRAVKCSMIGFITRISSVVSSRFGGTCISC